jgi:hypothetical protein
MKELQFSGNLYLPVSNAKKQKQRGKILLLKKSQKFIFNKK